MTLVLLLLAAAPGPTLKSFEGMNVKSLRPWLEANVASLAKCEATGEVKVSATFSTSPDVKVDKVDGADAACVKQVLEQWKNDGQQPRAGWFKFVYSGAPHAR